MNLFKNSSFPPNNNGKCGRGREGCVRLELWSASLWYHQCGLCFSLGCLRHFMFVKVWIRNFVRGDPVPCCQGKAFCHLDNLPWAWWSRNSVCIGFVVLSYSENSLMWWCHLVDLWRQLESCLMGSRLVPLWRSKCVRLVRWRWTQKSAVSKICIFEFSMFWFISPALFLDGQCQHSWNLPS